MNVIAKISCYLERGIVTLKSRKEYLNSVTHATSALLRIKNWTVWYIERYSMSTYTGVTNCQKTVRFFLAHPVYVILPSNSHQIPPEWEHLNPARQHVIPYQLTSDLRHSLVSKWYRQAFGQCHEGTVLTLCPTFNWKTQLNSFLITA